MSRLVRRSPAEWFYKYLQERRRAGFGAPRSEAGIQVVSIGNLTLGGTGKTPCAQWLARRLQMYLPAQNEPQVALICSGYGGQLSKIGAVVSDGRQIFLHAAQAGDEPVLHARALPGVAVIIGRDRHTAVRQASQLGCKVAILDDGFGFVSLNRACDIVLLDARHPFDNGHLLPRGRLREEPQALSRATLIGLTRSEDVPAEELARTKGRISLFGKAPIFTSCHVARSVGVGDKSQPLQVLAGAKIGALSAIAGNASFGRSLQQFGAQIGEHLIRRDHHFWHEREVRDLARRAAKNGAQALVTTEKDVVKIESAWCAPLPLWTLQIALQWDDEERVFQTVLQTLV